VWIEAERAAVDQEGDPDQIQAGYASCFQTIMIELGCRAGEFGSGPAQAKGVTGGQRRISISNQAPARMSREFGERCPDASHSRRESKDVESLPKVATAIVVGSGLQRGQLPDAVGVPE
jgi:hypothetical protein